MHHGIHSESQGRESSQVEAIVSVPNSDQKTTSGMIVDFGENSVSQISEVRISNLTDCFNNKDRMTEVTP